MFLNYFTAQKGQWVLWRDSQNMNVCEHFDALGARQCARQRSQGSTFYVSNRIVSQEEVRLVKKRLETGA